MADDAAGGGESADEEDGESTRLKLIVEAWKTTVDTQQHFNDLALRIRTAAVTVLTATIAAAGFALDKQLRISGGMPIAPFILLAGLVAWLAFFFMDKYWYHQLLIGAVKHGLALEDASGHPEILGLTKAISKASADVKFGFKPKAGAVDKRPALHSNARMNIFYFVIASLLVVFVAGTFLIGNPLTTAITATAGATPSAASSTSYTTYIREDSAPSCRQHVHVRRRPLQCNQQADTTKTKSP